MRIHSEHSRKRVKPVRRVLVVPYLSTGFRDSFEWVLAYLLLNQSGNLGLLTNELGFEDVEVPYILTLTKK